MDNAVYGYDRGYERTKQVMDEMKRVALVHKFQLEQHKRLVASYPAPIYPSKYQLEAERVVGDKWAMWRTYDSIRRGEELKEEVLLAKAQDAKNERTWQQWVRESTSGTPFLFREEHTEIMPRENKVREGLEVMDDTIRRENKIKALDLEVERIRVAFEVLFINNTPLDNARSLKRVLAACRRIAEGRSQQLVKPLDQMLGGKKSPNLVRVPTTGDGTLDVRALHGTVLNAAAETLTWEGYELPSPLYTESYSLLNLTCIVTKVNKVSKKTRDEVVDIGLYFDLEPHAVSMNSATLDKYETPRKGIKAIAKAARKAMATWWTKEVMENHTGWCRNAVLHVRVDLPDNEVVVDRITAGYIAQGMGVEFDKVDGTWLDLTGYPIVNGACRPRVKVRVLAEDGVQQHIAMSPHLAKLMGRDNDGDVVALHNAYKAINNRIFEMLIERGITNG